MLRQYIRYPLVLLPILILVGVYVEGGVIYSLRAVIGELHNVTLFILNDVSINNVVLEYNLNWNYGITSCIFLSIFLLMDRIPSSWRQLTLMNRVTSSRYTNVSSLIFNETLAYLESVPNIVTLSIGLIQAYNTYEVVKLETSVYRNRYRLIWLIGLISIVSYRIPCILNRVSSVSPLICSIGFMAILIAIMITSAIPIYIIKGNFVNLGVSLICCLFAIYQELQQFNISSKMDEVRNGNMIRCIRESSMTNSVEIIRSETLGLGDTVLLREGEVTPSNIIVDNLRYICDDDTTDYEVGTYYDRESTGEDVSRKFIKGATILANRELTRPDLEIRGRVSQYAKLDIDIVAMGTDSVPHFLDKVRIVADIVGFFLLLLISLSISASAVTNDLSQAINLQYLVTHLIAAAISANVLIPSMRMTLLYNIFNLVLSQLYTTISIKNYSCIPKLANIDRIIFDKTGTLTEECLDVGNYNIYPDNQLDSLASICGWSIGELEFALLMANNESNINPKTDIVWGTSPEECEMVKFWKNRETSLKLVNPLKDEGTVTFSLDGITYRTVIIIKRHSYHFGIGKLASIQLTTPTPHTITTPPLQNITLFVRQDGTSHISSSTISSGASTWSVASEKSDPRRSMSIAYCIIDRTLSTDLDLLYVPDPNLLQWQLVGIYSFNNPLRRGISKLIEFVTNRGLTPYILTGDGCEAAEEVSRRAGFPPEIVHYRPDMYIASPSTSPSTSLIISGSDLIKWLEDDPIAVKTFLMTDRHPKIIYRASSKHKESVARQINNAIYVGDAANDAAAIQYSRVGISLSHGAETCRLKADIIITSPPDLVDLLSENGYRDMLLAGGERLLEDVCWMGGLTAGCLVIGLHRNGFQFIANSPLYLETWKPLPMLVVSSFQYTLSVLAYASADCESRNNCWRCFASTRWHLFGLICGGLIAWTINHWIPDGNFSYLVLHALDITILVKHSWHCWRRDHYRFTPRRSGGLFGNQYLGTNGDDLRIIGFCLCILDSIPARCILYGIFSLLGERFF